MTGQGRAHQFAIDDTDLDWIDNDLSIESGVAHHLLPAVRQVHRELFPSKQLLALQTLDSRCIVNDLLVLLVSRHSLLEGLLLGLHGADLSCQVLVSCHQVFVFCFV